MWWIATVSFVVFVAALAAVRSGRKAPRCPDCHGDVADLSAQDGAHRTYDVHLCVPCMTAVTSSQGVQSTLTYCPVCGSRAMETPTDVQTQLSNGRPQVLVDEHCLVCGFADRVSFVPAGDRTIRSNVIPFPQHRTGTASQRSGEGH